MGERFRLVFSGDVLDGHRIEDVQRKMADMMRLPQARQASMFSGKRTVLKRGMTLEAATRYVVKFERLGAKVVVEPEGARQAAPGRDTPPPRPSAPRIPARNLPVIAAGAAVAVAALAVGGFWWRDGASPLAPRVTEARLAAYGLSDEARAAFVGQYEPAAGNKAFAASTGGAHGQVAGASSDQEAAQRALATCEGRRQPGAPACRLVDLGGSWAPVTP